MRDLHEYFPHDYSADGDENITRLLREHGNVGYGIFWRIIERLYRAGGLLVADFGLLSFDLREDEKKVSSIVLDFDLFYRKGKQFGSHSVDRRLSYRRYKSDKAQAAARVRYAPTVQTQCERTYIKEEKNIGTAPAAKTFKAPNIEEIKSYCQTRNNKVDAIRFLNFYESKGWMIGKNKMKSWQAAVRTWEQDAGFNADPIKSVPKVWICDHCHRGRPDVMPDPDAWDGACCKECSKAFA